MRQLLITALTYLFFIPTQAQIKIANLFSDNMVLQQNENNYMWGWGNANEIVTIEFSWLEKKKLQKLMLKDIGK